ncbi:MAG: MG2 domain-containing protein [Pricia sp.]
MKLPKLIVILNILILTIHMGHAQAPKESYDALWEKVQKLENDDLTKSALKQVQIISEKAKKEKNSAQVVKALLFTSKYTLILEEDAQLNIINDFRSEIEKAEFPTKSVLEGYLAHMYWQYFQQNRYQFYDRTQMENKVDSVDFRTWDLTTLFYEISAHFEASLENKEALQKTGLDDFKEILRKQTDSEIYRPTLYDVLAHTALDFYKTNENSITRPADTFEIDNPELLCEAYAFTQLKIRTQDPTALQSKALMVYQELLKFHFSDAELDALVDVDTERLEFIYQNAVFPNKDEVYLEVLQNSAENFKQHAVSSLYSHEIAQLLVKQGNTYAPKTNEAHRWKQKEALELCESVIARFPESRGADKCKALKSQILATQLQLTAETHIPTHTEARILIDYKNIENLQLSALEISQKQLTQLNELYREPEKLKFLQKLSVAKTWEATLKNENDYQRHDIEVLLPALDNGQYIILAKPLNMDTGKYENKTFAFSPVQVTDIAVVTHQLPETYQIQVLQRGNGRPISGAKVQLTYRKNNNQVNSNSTLRTDSDGVVSIPLSDDYWRDLKVQVSANNDIAYFGEFYINRRYDVQDPNKVTNACFLFTDRSIYRPGQPVYFKGILMESLKGSSKVLPEQMVFVRLNDVNGQQVSELELETNAFGSFNGEFILPNSGLTGEFSIQVSAVSGLVREDHYFSVEEYKRPKFETSFEPVTDTFRVNDSITVKGTANAYAGSNITDAKVSYRVKRVVRYPRWYYWSYPYFESTPREIAHGETKTDASGHYKIDFKALPDAGISKDHLPTFQYEVTADVTDINGETHTATTLVSVGYHALTANIGIPDRLNKNSKTETLAITTKNLNNQPVDARGKLKMYKLQAPDQVLRPRPWPAPDYKQWQKSEFRNHFPNEAYTNEDDPDTWDKGKLVWESDFDTGKTTRVPLELSKKWDSGKYLIELETTDAFGQEVKALARTTLYSDADKRLADHKLFQISTDKEAYSIGDKVEVSVASASEDLTVSVFVEKDKKIVSTHIIRLDDTTKSFSVPVTEDDLGGFAVNYSYSAYNSFASGSLPISVPYPKTDLQIETLTFRDKLAPGTDETWSFTIKGAKGDKVSAEFLASMYDASLDAFADHTWRFDPLMRPSYYSQIYTNARESFGVGAFRVYLDNDLYAATPQFYDTFDWFQFQFGSGNYAIFGNQRLKRSAPVETMVMEMEADGGSLNEVAMTGLADSIGQNPSANSSEPQRAEVEVEGNEEKESDMNAVPIRKNLRETAFFFPQLQTDSEGNVSFNFTTPEALTQWKLQLLAHTKSLESAMKTMEAVTQKELMVLPNTPRFLREGDEISISTKIANLTEKIFSGQAQLVLTDAVTNEDLTEKLLVSPSTSEDSTPANKVRSITHKADRAANGDNEQDFLKNFKVDAMGNTQVSWRLKIPEGVHAVQYKIIAKAGDFSDGEQHLLPVLTNRMLVTETLPMWVRSDQTKTFTLDKLKDNTSTTLKNHKLTLEITSNPAWYAVQALPYLMEYPYDCNEQTFARYYANALATYIANSNPRIQEVFRQWANSDALIGNMEKNEELKSLLIQETPWLRDAQSEAEQKKRIALLFNLDKMKNEKAGALNKLQNNQNPSGAWAWFKGGLDNRFITQHIVAGMGHLEKLTPESTSPTTSKIKTNNPIKPSASDSRLQNNRNPEQEQMIKNAIAYLDAEFITEYENMRRRASDINDDHLSPTQIHYLYMRSFFPDIKTSKKVDDITAYYKGQAQQYWTKKGLYPKGMLALALHRMNDTTTSNKILRALKENSITTDELGMYWKENKASWHAYQAPIETQALMIEAFGEIQNDAKIIDNLKVWLLKNKQTHQWKTTKATTEAVYALLLQGSDWLSVTDAVDVLVGGKKIEPSRLENVKVEAGTGYYKTAWDSKEIEPEMGEVQLSKKGKGIAWGALYWQYFENVDKITSAETPLKLRKKLFLKTNTDTGEEISEITPKTDLKVGDLVRVRIELRADRDMEFLHMKDMRAAGFEPINVLSQYKWQDGLGYYESTKDASTHFFFDYLPKGVYVFEYDVRVNNVGEFSNGITTIQSMYAPEFSSHSEGVRVEVRE